MSDDDIAFPPRAPKRDDLLRAMNNAAVGPDRQPIEIRGEYLDAMKTAEWFDFGEIDDSAGAASQLANDALPFANSRLIVLPYPKTIFRSRIGLHVKTEGEGIFKSEFVQLLLQPTPKDDIEIMSFMLIGWNFDRAMLMTHALGDGQTVKVSDQYSFKGDVSKVEYRMFMSMWLILNTRNVDRRVDTPSDKLNRARMKSGKLPLQRVTYISAKQYVEAERETARAETEGRSSPRTHLRRAHLRHLVDRIIPIHAVIVNGAQPTDRERYKVKS